MGLLYVGVGLIGFLGSFLVKPLTEGLDFHRALMIVGAMVLLAWPLAIFVLRDKPGDKGLYPDGADAPTAEASAKPRSFKDLTGRNSFWLLVAGSMCSIGSIGAVNFLMKLVGLFHPLRFCHGCGLLAGAADGGQTVWIEQSAARHGHHSAR
jgi:hypothetical protein